MTRLILLSAMLLSLACPAAAQPPSPADFLGYELGERFTFHNRIVEYFDTLAETSPLVEVERYGETTENRQLVRAVVTSEENRAQLAEIRSKLGELQDPGETSRERASEIARASPLIVLFAFGVHGDESSSPEAAMKLAHWLVTADDARSLLDRLVIVIDPVQNPDGRDQYVQFYTQAAGKTPNPRIESAEHDAPWRPGRANHYFVDMNRDWIWGTQVETQARIRQFREWGPQLFVDFHEMGSRETDYFFPPSADPVNKNVAEGTTRWLETFGRANAEAFSERGWLFYVGETFDLFYPGYGDAWPTLRGAIGMTFEVAGGRSAGKLVDRPNGTTLSLRERIDKHFVAGTTTLKTAAENREGLILHNYDALSANLRNGTTYLLDGRSPAAPLAVEILERQGIEFSQLSSDASLKVRSVLDGREETRSFEAGTIVVPTAQPMGRLARTLLERSPALEEEFVRQQKERVEAEESDQFYDITAWSLPVALNIGTWELTGGKSPSTTAWTKQEAVAVPTSRLGWAVSAYDANVYRMAGRLLAHGIRFSVASAPVTVGDVTLPRGSLLVHRANNDRTLAEIFPRLATEAGVTTVPVDTFWTRGIALGSSQVQFVKDPAIAILSGGDIDRYSFGAVWFQLDVRDEVPHTVLPVGRLGSADLGAYRVIVLPDGDYSDVSSRGVERLVSWVRDGGTVVAIKRASDLLRGEDVGLSGLEDWKPEGADAEPNEQAWIPRVPGAAFRTEMNERSFLTFGLTSSPAVLIDGDLSLRPLERKLSNVVRIVSNEPLAAGFAWPSSIERLLGAPYLVHEKAGEGNVITFTDDPNFRLFWRGTYPMLMNAILYGPSFDE
jgi:hypothetical protein